MLSAILEMIHELKEWTVALVIQHGQFTENAYWMLGFIAFIESSFFPIPPDIPFILMSIIQPQSAIVLAAICSVGSVLGGALGYCIGLFGGRPFVEWMLNKPWINWLFSREKFETVEGLYQRYDAWAVLIAAFTPLPYKVFTIAGGLCRIHFWRFMLFSMLGRAGRFFLVGTLLYFFGEYAAPLVKRFDLFLLVMLVMVVLGFFAIKFVKLGGATDKDVDPTVSQEK